MSENQKARFHEMAAQDKARYESELQNANPFFVRPGTQLTQPGVELQLAFGPEAGVGQVVDDPALFAYELNGRRPSVRNGDNGMDEEEVVERRSRKRRARGSEEHGDDQGDGDGPPSDNGGDNPGSPGDGGGENGSENESDGQSDGGNGTGGSGSDGDGGNGSGDENNGSGDGNDGAGEDGDDEEEEEEEEEDESTTEEDESSSSDESATGVVFQGSLVSNAPLRGRGPRVRGGHYGRDIVQ
jgi:hypothetical protein